MTVLVKIETLETLSLDELKARIPGWAPPDPPSPESLEGTGWAILQYDDKPAGDYVDGEIREENGQFVQSWKAADLTDEQWKKRIADRRYQAETSGTTIEGMPIDTGRDSQGLITGAALAAVLDAEYVLRWKTLSGFVELSGAQIIAVASAIRAFVQSCFDREAALLDAVADGSITAEMLGEGWPT